MIDPTVLGLETFNISGHEIQVLCPFHDDHKPSASFNMKKGLFYCYACGMSMNARRLAEELGGEIEHITDVSKLRKRQDDKEWRPLLYSPLALDHPYLLERKVTNEQITRHSIQDLGSGIGFVLRDRSDSPIGIQERLISSKGSRYILHGRKPPVWPFGNHFLSEHRPLLVEGVFGFLRCERAGVRAYATLSSQITSRTTLFLNGRRPIVWFDSDYAGIVGAAKLVISCMASVIISKVASDETNSAKNVRSIVRNAVRTSNLSDLAELSGRPEKFFQHIKHWRQKYAFSIAIQH